MIGQRVRDWFAPESRAAATEGYTAQLLARQYAAARAIDGARGTAAYAACLNLIGHSVSTAQLDGEFSEALRPHLASIGRGLMDRGESTFELGVSAGGLLTLLPCSIVDVRGAAQPTGWHYGLMRRGPSETTAVSLPAAAVVSFRINSDPRTPWRGNGALDVANSTGALFGEIESQLALEARVKPTRVLTAGAVKGQARDIEASIQRGGIVSILQAGATASITDPSGLRAGVLKNETTASVVDLREQVERVVCAVLGVPSDLILAGSEAGSRESFRRFAAATIAPLLQIVRAEWEAKVSPLTISLDELRASDSTARGRVLSQRAAAFKNLVGGGVPVDRALKIAGLDG